MQRNGCPCSVLAAGAAPGRNCLGAAKPTNLIFSVRVAFSAVVLRPSFSADMNTPAGASEGRPATSTHPTHLIALASPSLQLPCLWIASDAQSCLGSPLSLYRRCNDPPIR